MNKSTNNVLNRGKLKKITTYQAGVLQATTHRNLQKHSDNILKKFGITKMQWLIIGTVHDAGSEGIRLTELTEKLDTTMSYLTNTVNLLESKGILDRVSDTTDSRAKFIRINQKFSPKCTEIEKDLRDELRKSIYSHVKPEDFAIYLKVLHQLSKVENS